MLNYKALVLQILKLPNDATSAEIEDAATRFAETGETSETSHSKPVLNSAGACVLADAEQERVRLALRISVVDWLKADARAAQQR